MTLSHRQETGFSSIQVALSTQPHLMLRRWGSGLRRGYCHDSEFQVMSLHSLSNHAPFLSWDFTVALILPPPHPSSREFPLANCLESAPRCQSPPVLYAILQNLPSSPPLQHVHCHILLSLSLSFQSRRSNHRSRLWSVTLPPSPLWHISRITT